MTLTEYPSNQSKTATVVLGKDGILRGVGSSAVVSDNQSFLLATGNLSYATYNPYGRPEDIIEKTY